MLDLENVNAYYGDSQVCMGVSLAVNEGEVVCLLGRNGAGKTTATDHRHRQRSQARPGRILFRGRDIAAAALRASRPGFGFVPQVARTSNSTVRENLTVFARDGWAAAGPSSASWSCFRACARASAISASSSPAASSRCSRSHARSCSIRSPLLLDEPSEGLAPMIVQDIVERRGISSARVSPSCWWSRTCAPRWRSPTATTS